MTCSLFKPSRLGAGIALSLSLLLGACNSGNTSDSAEDKSATAPQPAAPADTTEGPEVVVYKSATCGCCTDWVDYLEEEGFRTRSINTEAMVEIKAEHGLHERELMSCHTALVDGYLIEGHVPASDIRRLLEERPADTLGLTAPGMPAESPGMASRTPKNYDVLSFDADGNTSVFSSY